MKKLLLKFILLTALVACNIGNAFAQQIKYYCGGVVPSMTTPIYCTKVPTATQYAFEVSGPMGYYQIHWVGTQAFFKLTNLAQPVSGGTPYTIRAHAFNGTTYLSSGTPCVVITPGVPTTSILSVCGTTISSLSTTIYAAANSQATYYEFNVTDGVSYNSSVKTVSPYFKLTSLSGIQYGTTYNISVRLYIGSTAGAYSGACSVTTPAFPSTAIDGSICSTTLTSLGTTINATPVTGASAYEFRIVSTHTSVPSDTITTVSPYFKISNSPVGRYGTTYDVDVRANVGGVWGSRSAACQVTTPAFPTAQMQGTCPRTLSSITEYIYAVPILGASNYEFEISNSGLSYLVTWPVGSGGYFKFSALSGIQANTTYDVRVRVKVGGVWNSYSSVCQITTPGSIITPYNDGNIGFGDISFADENGEQNFHKNSSSANDNNAISLGFELYPNPSKDGNVSLLLTYSTHNTQAFISLYDISGRELANYTYTTSPGITNTITADFNTLNLSKGIYFVKVKVGSEQLNKKLIIE